MTEAVVDGEVAGERGSLDLVRAERSGVMITPVMNVALAQKRLKEFQEFIGSYLTESKDGGNDGGDFGVIPGTAKKTLLKSGADKLCEVYGLYDEYEVLAKVEDWALGLFDYTLRCILKTRRDDTTVGSGVGSCSTFESKYRWRQAQRLCPLCSQPAIIKGKQEYGGGWICFERKGGCKAKFKDDDLRITGQIVGRVENPDIIDAKNTALKMAKKRAKIDAVISVTRSAGLFTQDVEDAIQAEQVIVERVEQEQQSPAQTQQPAPAQTQAASQPAPGSAGAERLISEAQGKRLWAIAREQNVTEACMIAHIKALGYNSTTEIQRKHYETIVAWAQAGGQDLPK